MPDFDADIGVPYELPDNAPKQGEFEQFQYYQHPAGLYIGFVGKLNSKFKGADGKPLAPDMPGATFDHYQLALWITKFLGSTTNPKSEELITISANGSIILPNRPTMECYYGLYISTDPKRAWSMAKTFEDWRIPGHAKYNIIQQSGKNMATKVVNYNGFPAYYGLGIKFALTYKPESEKQTRYIDGKVDILDMTKRIPFEKLQEFETAVEVKVKAEQSERASKKNTYEAAPPAETDFDLLASDNNSDDSLDDFLK